MIICKMNDNEKYISGTFGIETTIIPLENRLFRQLPLYITAAYKIQEATFYGQRVCLLIAKSGESELTPDQLYKQMILVSQKLELPVVFVFNKILSYNIKRLIHKGINFIITNKQMFIPALMMVLRKMPATIPEKTELLTSNAQFFLLYHLQKEALNGLTTQEVAGKFNQSYLTANRAVKCLKELDLCNLTGGKEKQIQFVAKGKELWQKAQPFFQNPVERIVFTDEILQYTQSNINALAHYSMLNNEEKRYYAVGKEIAKNLAVETNKYAGDNVIEIWRYFPDLLSDNGFVDKLSLYLLLKNDKDVRVQTELEQMINNIKWLEE